MWDLTSSRGISGKSALQLCHTSARKIQRAWRCHKFRLCFNNHLESRKLVKLVKVQALVRGWLVRRNMSAKHVRIYENVQTHNRRASLPSSRSVKQNFNSSIASLLEAGQYSAKCRTLDYIEKWTCILRECCEKLMMDDSVHVLFSLVNLVGRDFEAAQIVQPCISIFNTLIKNPTSRDEFLKIVGSYVADMFNVLVRFEDKSGKDKRRASITASTCRLLCDYLQSSPARLQYVIENHKSGIKRTAKIFNDAKAKHMKQVQINKRRSTFVPVNLNSTASASVASYNDKVYRNLNLLMKKLNSSTSSS